MLKRLLQKLSFDGRMTAPSVNQASRRKHILIVMKACEMANVGSVVIPSCSISAVRVCGLGMWPTPWTVTSLKLCFCGLSLSSLCMSDSLPEYHSLHGFIAFQEENWTVLNLYWGFSSQAFSSLLLNVHLSTQIWETSVIHSIGLIVCTLALNNVAPVKCRYAPPVNPFHWINDHMHGHKWACGKAEWRSY